MGLIEPDFDGLFRIMLAEAQRLMSPQAFDDMRGEYSCEELLDFLDAARGWKPEALLALADGSMSYEQQVYKLRKALDGLRTAQELLSLLDIDAAEAAVRVAMESYRETMGQMIQAIEAMDDRSLRLQCRCGHKLSEHEERTHEVERGDVYCPQCRSIHNFEPMEEPRNT